MNKRTHDLYVSTHRDTLLAREVMRIHLRAEFAENVSDDAPGTPFDDDEYDRLGYARPAEDYADEVFAEQVAGTVR